MKLARSTLALVLVLAALAFAEPARAGDRQLEILLVNMTPEPTAEGRACMREIERRVREEYSHVTRMGETPLRRLVGDAAAEDFTAWSYGDLAPVVQRGPDGRGETWLDSVVLVDCRPEARRADVVVTSPARGLTLLTLRDVPIDRRRARWLADTFLRQSWTGFSP